MKDEVNRKLEAVNSVCKMILGSIKSSPEKEITIKIDDDIDSVMEYNSVSHYHTGWREITIRFFDESVVG